MAIGVILAANAAAFAGILWNRSGTTAVLHLTERELSARYAGPESTAVTLRVNWQTADREGLLSREGLARLGFDTGKDPADKGARHWYERQLPREAYAALEYDGRAWRQWVAERREGVRELEAKVAEGAADSEDLEEARSDLRDDIASHSRLFAVAVGRDPARLGRRYREGSRYLIVRAVVDIDHFRVRKEDGEEARSRVEGDIRAILPHRLHVPHGQMEPVRATLEGERESREARRAYWRNDLGDGPRYRVEVRSGRSRIPWVERVTVLESGAGPES